jgi:hypothetical protein
MCSLLCLIMREFSLDWAMHDMSWVWQTTKRRSEEEWARGEFVHHYITSNSALSTGIDTTPKTAANGSKISTTRLHFSHQRHGNCGSYCAWAFFPQLGLLTSTVRKTAPLKMNDSHTRS